MEIGLPVRFALFFFLLAFSALFSAAEVALFSLSQVQVEMLKEKEGKKGARVSKLLASPSKLLVTIYIGNEIINVAIAAVATTIAMHFFDESGIIIAVAIGTFLLLIFGEVTPKTFASRHSQSYALAIAGPLSIFAKLVMPLQSVVTRVTNFILSLTGSDTNNDAQITEDEMKTVLEQSEGRGVIEADEKEMILNVFELGDTLVTEVMTPRTEIFSLDADENFETLAKRASLSSFSRIPLFKGERDNIIGILYSKDFLEPELAFNDNQLNKIIREPYIIPTTKKIGELLREFRKKRTHIAIVMDEYGGLDGLITLEDILEEVVGEDDDGTKEEQSVEKVSPDIFHLYGRMSIEDFNDYFSSSISVEDVDTIGGYVFHLFGRMPKSGESITDDTFKFTVRKLKRAKIWQLAVKKRNEEDVDDEIEQRR